MSDFQKDLETIKNPANIREALYASGPGVLMKVFEQDPTVKRLVREGARLVPPITSEIEKHGMKLPGITLSCFAYILQQANPAAAAAVLRPLFLQAMERPDPFFIYFAAHALRQDLKLSFRPDDPEYSYAQLQETKAWVERAQKYEGGNHNA